MADDVDLSSIDSYSINLFNLSDKDLLFLINWHWNKEIKNVFLLIIQKLIVRGIIFKYKCELLTCINVNVTNLVSSLWEREQRQSKPVKYGSTSSNIANAQFLVCLKEFTTELPTQWYSYILLDFGVAYVILSKIKWLTNMVTACKEYCDVTNIFNNVSCMDFQKILYTQCPYNWLISDGLLSGKL